LARSSVNAIRIQGDLIGLEPARVIVDVVRFTQLGCLGGTAALEEAIGLYHGDLLEGFSVDEPPFEDWLRVERERLRCGAVEALRNFSRNTCEGESSTPLSAPRRAC
jgi:hypothetical protein